MCTSVQRPKAPLSCPLGPAQEPLKVLSKAGFVFGQLTVLPPQILSAIEISIEIVAAIPGYNLILTLDNWRLWSHLEQFEKGNKGRCGVTLVSHFSSRTSIIAPIATTSWSTLQNGKSGVNYVASEIIPRWFEGPRLEMLKRWRTDNQSGTQLSTCRLVDPVEGVEWKVWPT